jgi:hypothetical protein
VVDEGIEGPEGDPGFEPSFDPDVEELSEKYSELTGIELEVVISVVGGASGERGINLEIGQFQFIHEIPIEGIGAGFEASAMEDGNDPHMNAGAAGFIEALAPALRVIVGAAVEEFPYLVL